MAATVSMDVEEEEEEEEQQQQRLTGRLPATRRPREGRTPATAEHPTTADDAIVRMLCVACPSAAQIYLAFPATSRGGVEDAWERAIIQTSVLTTTSS